MGWREWLWKENIGKRVTAKVLKKVDNGILVELESGVFAKIPFYELAWNPQDIISFSERTKIGDAVEVVITAIVPRELRIVASIKRLNDEEWKNISEKYTIGQEVRGSVRALVPSGAFVYLSDGMEGFIPLSEISPRPVKKIENALIVEDNVICIVTKIDAERKNLDLSIKGYLKKVAEEGGKRYALLKEEKEPPSEDRESPVESVPTKISETEVEESRIEKVEGIGRILVVDDEESYRKSFKEMLHAMGYEVDVALNDKEAVEGIKEKDYSTAFIDVYLPDLNGFEITKEILKIKPCLPIVLMTGRSELPDASQEDLTIPYVTLRKPIEAEKIIETLQNIADGRKSPPPAEEVI
ncbi:MAG: S1 RNA-binding domain-containing protein, partial [Candidatus Desantisbacteria bacterium]